MAKLVTTETLADALKDGNGNARSLLLSDRLVSSHVDIGADKILNGTGVSAMLTSIGNTYATKASLNDYATKTYVGNQGFLTNSDLSGYATTSELSDYATTSAMNSALAAKLTFAVLGANDNPPSAASSVSHTVYLKPNSGSGTNVYDEYLCVNKGTEQDPNWAWEQIGTTSYSPETAEIADIRAAFGIT